MLRVTASSSSLETEEASGPQTGEQEGQDHRPRDTKKLRDTAESSQDFSGERLPEAGKQAPKESQAKTDLNRRVKQKTKSSLAMYGANFAGTPAASAASYVSSACKAN